MKPSDIEKYILFSELSQSSGILKKGKSENTLAPIKVAYLPYKSTKHMY